MKKILFLVLLSVLIFSIPAYSTSGLDWAMFRTYTSPAYVPGENGLISIPTTDLLGAGKLALAFSGIDSGKSYDYNEQKSLPVVFSTLSVHYNFGNFLEVGATKKSILWGWERTDIEGQTLNAKFRLKKGTLPIAVGATILNLSDRPEYYNEKTTFFNAFAVTSLELRGLKLKANVGMEVGVLGDDKTKPFFYAGAQKDFGGLRLMAELIGTDEQGKGGLFNAGASFRLGGKTRVGISAYDIGNENRLMLQSSLVMF